jgi:hypothetical protein
MLTVQCLSTCDQCGTVAGVKSFEILMVQTDCGKLYWRFTRDLCTECAMPFALGSDAAMRAHLGPRNPSYR